MRKKIFTWHIHGSYLYYLSLGNYEIYIPVNEKRDEGYYGRGLTFPFGPNVIEVPAEEVKTHHFDVVLYQTDRNYLVDQYDILSPEQRKLPRIFLKHDPPIAHPVNARLVVVDPEVTVVHVTHFNHLMWDNGNSSSYVISHGVSDMGHLWSGEIQKGIVVINNLPTRGRLLGLDIFNKVRKKVPLDLVGLGAEPLGGYEVLHPQLPAFISKYRFFFNPIRYTSLGLAVCEAMMQGMPVVGMATTEMSVALQNGVNGFIHTNTDYLIEKMKFLLDRRAEAKRIGDAARLTAMQMFDISRFTGEWESLFSEVMQKSNVMEKNM
ncbi:MAG TPA: glycosyltransferase [Bacteroidales bacterium]|nr:glycosyltransferase [Bacteroidales bacterium]